MSMDERIKGVLRRAGGFEVTNYEQSEDRLRITGRVAQEDSQRWNVLMKHLLLSAGIPGESPWQVDLSRKYFVRDDKMLFSWRIIVAAEPDTKLSDALITFESIALEVIPLPRMDQGPDVVDVPLQASSTRLGLGPEGKGARIIKGSTQ